MIFKAIGKRRWLQEGLNRSKGVYLLKLDQIKKSQNRNTNLKSIVSIDGQSREMDVIDFKVGWF